MKKHNKYIIKEIDQTFQNLFENWTKYQYYHDVICTEQDFADFKDNLAKELIEDLIPLIK